MRDSFQSKKEVRSQPESQSQGRQRSISKETQTSNALEFKAKFETGKVSNLSKVSRSNSPYKPPKVDKTHLSKVKTKFNDISTDNLPPTLSANSPSMMNLPGGSLLGVPHNTNTHKTHM